ncbi:Chymotrypsin-1 [Ooceraea biroi]|uniref:Chymotrypsin-1 n=1 Tax=Ooceraea biroi TaxID=2015173 RepID=A0A026WEX4_OOCBI|nr:Chymotrypsin-1 [Ooceraea biroi]
MLSLTVFLVLGVLAQQTFADEPEAIVGGLRAAPGEFPWQCSMTVNGRHNCGCSIIGPNKILTAAHCLHGIVAPPYSNLRILTGNININQGSSHVVESARMHPDYIPTREAAWVNDVAVITLKTSIEFNEFQTPIPLADAPPVPGTICTLSGWGRTDMLGLGPASPVLLKMDQSLVSNQVCQASHGLKLTESHLCAFNGRGIGACSGDSGGPLVCNGKQYGITSFARPCAVGLSDVYTSVYHHLQFINSS